MKRLVEWLRGGRGRYFKAKSIWEGGKIVLWEVVLKSVGRRSVGHSYDNLEDAIARAFDRWEAP